MSQTGLGSSRDCLGNIEWLYCRVGEREMGEWLASRPAKRVLLVIHALQSIVSENVIDVRYIQCMGNCWCNCVKATEEKKDSLFLCLLNKQLAILRKVDAQ